MKKNTVYTEKRASVRPDWVYLGLLMLAYVIVGINTYRLQPVLTTLMSYLSADTGQVGFLMSICTFVTLCLAIPLGFVLVKLECWRAMLIALFMEIAGSVIGFFFTTYAGIAVSQILFGFANTIVTVCAPYLLQLVYEKQKFSTVIGYMNACQTVGMAVAFLILPMFLTASAFSNVWLLTAAPSVVLLILWIPAVNRRTEKEIWERAKQRQREELAETAGSLETAESLNKEKRMEDRRMQESRAEQNNRICEDGLPDQNVAGKVVSPLKSRRIWLVTLGTFFIMFSAGAVLSFASSFLTSVHGIEEGTAAQIVLSSAIVGMFCSAFVGIICSRTGKRSVYAAIVVFLALLRLLMVIAPSGVLLNIVIALQGVPAASIVVVNSVVPDLCPPVESRPLVISMISTASMAGMCLSAAVFGIMISWWGYNNALLALIPVSLVALIGTKAIPEK